MKTTTATRPDLSRFTTGRLADAWDEAWERQVALTRASAHIGEELVARLVESHLPDAHRVVLMEDTSHGGPHAHIRYIEDVQGNVLIEGVGQQWHDLAWTGEVDDLVYELFPLLSAQFAPITRGGNTFNGYILPVSVSAADEAEVHDDSTD